MTWWSHDLAATLYDLGHLVVAYLLAIPIGWDREKSARSAGLRTFPLVATGACAFMLIGLGVLEGSEPRARIMYGIVAGIGFIGGGAIIKQGPSVSGTATAASIWNTGAMGIAVAWNQYGIALVFSALNFLTLRYVRRTKIGVLPDNHNHE